MSVPGRGSGRLRANWAVDALLLGSAIVACLSGIYFLIVPLGGFRGGHNPMYGVEVLFERHTWEDMHTWGGIAMLAVAIIHVAMHWRWGCRMARRVVNAVRGGGPSLTPRGWYNLGLNVVVAASFALTAVSGLALFVAPNGHSTAVGVQLLFTRVVWDLLHTWAGVVFMVVAVLHLDIHWLWVVKTTRRLVGAGATGPRAGAIQFDGAH